MTKTKHEMRKEAIERLKSAISVEGEHLSYGRVIEVLSGRPTCTEGAGVYAETLIDLLTDDDEDMSDYIKLPKDANGEVIELWDKITYHGPYSRCRDRVFEVRGYCASGRTIGAVFVNCDGDYVDLAAKECCHYYKPTIEDVLREFADEVRRCCDTEDTIAEYAKKLQLKKDE